MIRILTEPELIKQVESWDEALAEKYEWFAAVKKLWHNHEKKDWIYVGIFDPELKGCVQIDPGEETEVHLSCDPSIDRKELIISTIAIRNWWLRESGCRLAYLWTPLHNRAVRRLVEHIGFVDTGNRLEQGEYRGRPLKWVQYAVQKL